MEKFYFTFECDNNPLKMHENADGTRHCTECSKNIHDFTKLNPAQFLEFRRKNPEGCGYMMPWQPDKINAYLQQQNKKSTTSFQWAKIAAVVTTPLFASHTHAQTDKLKTQVENTLNKESATCSELLLRDAHGNTISDIEFDVYHNTELLEKIKPDSTGKISISHTKYRAYTNLRIVHPKYKIEQFISVRKQPVCTIWQIDIDKLREEEQSIVYDLQFVYKNGRGKTISLTKIEIELYDSTNTKLDKIATKTNISGYASLKNKEVEKTEEVLFIVYTRKGRRTAYLNTNELKKGEINVISISKKFKMRTVGVYF